MRCVCKRRRGRATWRAKTTPSTTLASNIRSLPLDEQISRNCNVFGKSLNISRTVRQFGILGGGQPGVVIPPRNIKIAETTGRYRSARGWPSGDEFAGENKGEP